MSTKISPQSISQKMACTALALVLSATFAGSVLAGEREQAKRIHDRLTGVPPSADCLTQLETKVTAGDAVGAAMDAITNDGGGDNCIGKEFYQVTLKNFITPWTNEEQTVFAPLNDYTATVIGIIRDGHDFRRILYDDILYTGPDTTNLVNNSNAHYKALEDTGADLQVGTHGNHAVCHFIGNRTGRYPHHPCCCQSLFCRWHQPRHVPFYPAQSFVY